MLTFHEAYVNAGTLRAFKTFNQADRFADLLIRKLERLTGKPGMSSPRSTHSERKVEDKTGFIAYADTFRRTSKEEGGTGMRRWKVTWAYETQVKVGECQKMHFVPMKHMGMQDDGPLESPLRPHLSVDKGQVDGVPEDTCG